MNVIRKTRIESMLACEKETRGQHEFRSAEREKLDDTLDSLIWAVQRWKGEKQCLVEDLIMVSVTSDTICFHTVMLTMTWAMMTIGSP